MSIEVEEPQIGIIENGKDLDVSFDVVVTSLNTNALLYFIFVLSVFILFVLYCIPQIFLVYFGYNDSISIQGTVVSPFDSILEEYSPKSSKPCVYSTLDYLYDSTAPCNCTFYSFT